MSDRVEESLSLLNNNGKESSVTDHHYFRVERQMKLRHAHGDYTSANANHCKLGEQYFWMRIQLRHDMPSIRS